MIQVMEDQFDWKRKEGSTTSTATGPDKAHHGDYYLYIEGSLPNQHNHVAM